MEATFRIDDPYAFLTKDLLTKEYVENKLTDKQIAQKYNIKSKVTIWRRRKFLGVKNAYQSKSNKNASVNRVFNITKEVAARYLLDGLTYQQMAERLGCSRMVLYRRVKELGLIKNQRQTMPKLKWHEEIDDLQTRFLLGCLLGDGNITPRGMFQCSHSYKQLRYIKYKKGVLKTLIAPSFDLIFNSIKNHQNGKTYYAYYLRTMNNKNLKKIYDIYYIDKVKIFPCKYLMQSSFDAYSLAIWYMDDGCRNSNISTLCTFGFGYSGNLDILKFLKAKFELEGILVADERSIRSHDKKHSISFKGEMATKFFQLVAPHILPSLQYKLPEKYRTEK